MVSQRGMVRILHFFELFKIFPPQMARVIAASLPEGNINAYRRSVNERMSFRLRKAVVPPSIVAT